MIQVKGTGNFGADISHGEHHLPVDVSQKLGDDNQGSGPH